MYRITIQTLTDNEHTIYFPGSEEYTVTSAVLSLSVGNAGTFEFTMPFSNPLYNEIVDHSIITVYEDNLEIWRGDIQDIKQNFDKSLDVYCLEDLAWLSEEAVAMTAITNETYLQRFTGAIASYNANQVAKRQFTQGVLTSVTTTHTCNWLPKYEENLLDCLRNYIADDGYVRIRRVIEHGSLVRYVDIVRLADFGQQADQTIEFGSNLLDFVKEMDNTNFLNVLYPYGKETENELYGDVMQRIVGTPIQNDASIAVYGRRARSVIFETESEAKLNSLALAYLNRYSQPIMKIQVKAVDLGNIELVNRIHLGDSVRIIANTFAIDQWDYVTKQDLDLLDIANNQITLSDSVKTRSLTSQVAEQATEIKDIRSPLSVLDEAKKNAMSILQGENGGIVTFEVNGEEQIVGILIANNLDITQATKAWGWNINGLCYVHRQYPSDDWTLGIAMTMNGEIVADYITTGEMSADRINGGHIRASLITALNSALVQVIDESTDYSGAYVPNDLTSPTYNWNTEALKKQHEGDTFLNTSTNKGYVYSYVNDYPESDHPYDEHSHDYYYKFTLDFLSGPIKITFDSQCKTETGWDYVDLYYVYENDTYNKRYTGNFGGLEAVIPVNEFYLHFYTDGNNNEWGWKIDSIEHTDDPLTGFTTGSALPTPSNGWNEVTGKHYYQWIETNLANYIAQKATAEVNNMSAEQMFELLTDGGNVQGMFFQNDQVYFNATYIKTGFLSADIIRTGGLLADRIKGGTLTLGGYNDINGKIYLVSAVNYIAGTSGTDNYTANLGYAQTGAEGECVGVLEISNLSADAATLVYEVTYCMVSGSTISEILFDNGTFEVDSGSNTFTLPKKMEVQNNSDYYKIKIKKAPYETVTFDVDVNYAIVYGTLGENGIKTIKGSFGKLSIDGTDSTIYTLGNTQLYSQTARTSASGTIIKINNKLSKIIGSFTVKAYFTGTVASGQSYADGTEGGSILIQRKSKTSSTWSTLETIKFKFNEVVESSTSIDTADFDSYDYRLSVSRTSVSTYLSACERKITTSDYRTFNIAENLFSGNFKGFIDSDSGNIGGWEYGNNTLYTEDTSGFSVSFTTQQAFLGRAGSYISQDIIQNVGSSSYNAEIELVSGTSNIRISASSVTNPDITRSGSGITTTNVYWRAPSDKRLKENITNIDAELSKAIIDSVEPVRFKFKKEKGIHYGMLAQDVRKVLDALGETDAQLEFSQGSMNDLEDQRAINYEEFIPLLINVYKMQQREIEELKKQIKEEK